MLLIATIFSPDPGAKAELLSTFSAGTFLEQACREYWLALIAAALVLLCHTVHFVRLRTADDAPEVSLVVRWISLPFALWGLEASTILISFLTGYSPWPWYDLFICLTALVLITVSTILVFALAALLLPVPVAVATSQLLVILLVIATVLSDWFFMLFGMTPHFVDV